MVSRMLRLLTMVGCVTVFVMGPPAERLKANGVYQCGCTNEISNLYDYTPTFIASNDNTWTLTDNFSVFSMAACGSYCQNWILGVGNGLCQAQGWDTRGQGYVYLEWNYLWYDGNGNSQNSGPDGGWQQFDCADTYL
jgi:hypothetical protein